MWCRLVESFYFFAMTAAAAAGTYVAHGSHGTVWTLLNDPSTAIKLFNRGTVPEMERRFREQLHFFEQNPRSSVLPEYRGSGYTELGTPFILMEYLSPKTWKLPQRLPRKDGALRRALLDACARIRPTASEGVPYIWQDLLTAGNFCVRGDSEVRFFEGGSLFEAGRSGAIPYAARILNGN